MCSNDMSGVIRRAYRQDKQFDRYQKDRILNLLRLKARCHLLDEALMSSLGFTGFAMSFYTAIGGAVDCLLFSQITDEASACLEDGGPIGELLASIAMDARDQGLSPGTILPAIHDMESLFQHRREFVIGSVFFDFVVSTFSAFEMFMARVYDPLRLGHPLLRSV